jgi:hypothetical protein
LQGAAVNQWVALPSLSSSSVLPSPALPGSVVNVTNAWCGATVRPTGSYYLLHGGGHADYSGNEIYALKLSDDSPQWSRVMGPTPSTEYILPLTSLTWASGTVTGTIGTNFPTGLITSSIAVSGCTPAGYNLNPVTGTITAAHTFTYPLASNPGTCTVLGNLIDTSFYYWDGPGSVSNLTNPSPSPIHTYHLLQYLASQDTFLRFGRAGWTQDGIAAGMDGWVWGATSWLPTGTFTTGNSSYVSGYTSGFVQGSAGNFYTVGGSSLYLYNSTTNTGWSVIATSTVSTSSGPSCYDSLRNVIWTWGYPPYSNTVAGQVSMWNLPGNPKVHGIAAGAAGALTMTGTGATAMYATTNMEYGGAVYDPVVDKIFIADGTATIYQFDPATLIATTVATSGATYPNMVTAHPGTGACGPLGKLQYVPALGGVVIQPDWTSSTYFMRTH